MSNFNRKVTAEQAKELLAHYVKHGKEASLVRCAELGVSPKYAASLAASLGIRIRKLKGGGQIAKSVDHNDPRWQWAIERGPVVAP
jgi:hypothetical protein